MYIPDLSPYCYRLPYCLNGVQTVGWLDASHDFPVGNPSNELIDKLRVLIKTRTKTFDLHVNTVRGIHPCNFCGEDIQLDRKTMLGMSEIWIPSGELWLATPSLVIHYMEAHGYIPPNVFSDGVIGLDTSMTILSQAEYDRLIRVASSEES